MQITWVSVCVCNLQESIVDEVEIVGGSSKGKKTKKQVKVLPKWQVRDCQGFFVCGMLAGEYPKNTRDSIF